MEFIKISDIKLKVTLTEEERNAYRIDASGGEASGSDIKRTIREILTVAEEKCGFRTDGDRLLVQLYPLPSGSAELLVTRLAHLSRRDRAEICATDGLELIERRARVYRFLEDDDLRRAVRAVYREGLDSDLYRDNLGRLYIQVTEDMSGGVSDLEALVEFGERLPALPIAVVAEYGTLLAKGDAIAQIYHGKVLNRNDE